MLGNNKCRVNDCANKKEYTMGNGQFFCRSHHHLGNKYTRIEIESSDIIKEKVIHYKSQRN